jgi:hypothetical protein
MARFAVGDLVYDHGPAAGDKEREGADELGATEMRSTWLDV